MAFTKSPLFVEAGRQIQAAARRQFRSSDFGRLYSEVESAMKRSRRSPEQVRNALKRFSRGTNPDAAVRQMMGSDFGEVIRAVQRYAKPGASQRVVNEFLETLGPAGHLIRSLIDPTKKTGLQAELKAAMNLIRAFGGEVIPGKGEQWNSVEDVQRGLMAMQRRLQDYGFAIVGSEGPPRRAMQTDPGRSTVDVGVNVRRVSETGTEMEYGKPFRLPADHPMLTGDMVQTSNSTNVYEFGYDYERFYLYVRFQAKHGKNQRGGAGPLYRYSGVTPREFLALYAVKDLGGGIGPGDWVWDALRQRGTVSGHKKDYELVGVVGGYVPRKATLKRSKPLYGKRSGKLLKRKGLEEWYESRTVKTHQGRMLRSVLPTERVMPARGPR
jgi:hypothetical protein